MEGSDVGKMLPWDQRVARVLVRPLAATPVTPNQVTALTLVLAVIAAVLFASGEAARANLAAGLFVLARFLDHFDGELARLTGNSSHLGYLFDYFAGAGSYCVLFLGIGIGLTASSLGGWSLALGIAGALSAVVAMPLNLGIDSASESTDAVGYPGFAGFELEDGIYLIAPITWLGFLREFFVLAGIGAVVYLLWTAWSLIKARRGLPSA